jgi:hypothetical protein
VGEHERRSGGSNELPPWLRSSIIAVLSVLFVVPVVYDMLVKDYTGTPTSFMLGGIVGTAIGVNKIISINRGDGGPTEGGS